jgi:Co/Zn/Cd efflux system component
MHKHFVQTRDPRRNRKITGILLLLLLIGFVIQFFGSLFADSSSVMSDAFHMLVDGSSQFVYWLVLTLAVWGMKPPKRIRNHPSLVQHLQKAEASTLWSFGDRACAFLLFGAACSTLWTSIWGLAYPKEVHLEISIPIVVVGLVVNLVNLLVIMGSRAQKDLKAVLLHVKADLYHSLIILLGQLFDWWVGNNFTTAFVVFVLFVDPLLSIWLGCWMMRWSWKLLKESMQGKQWNVGGVQVQFPVHVKKRCSGHDHGEQKEVSHHDHQKDQAVQTCCSHGEEGH